MENGITKVSLELAGRRIQLRVYGRRFQKGHTAIEDVPLNTGKSLPGLRRSGAKHAKSLGVPFEDHTAGADR